MGYSLDQFAAECHDALEKDSGAEGLEQVRRCVEKALADKEFVAAHLGPDNHEQRKILYEDPEFGFCILAHVYEGARESQPHDHGPSWAIYGQADGVTVMTDWKLLEKPKGSEPGRVEKVRSYELKPGMAKAYGIGVLHSPSRADTTRLIRIEGENMEKVNRDKFVAA